MASSGCLAGLEEVEVEKEGREAEEVVVLDIFGRRFELGTSRLLGYGG